MTENKKLIKQLRSLRESKQIEATRKLGKLKVQEAIEPLIKTLRSNSLEVVNNTIWALGEIGDTRAIEAFSLLSIEFHLTDDTRLAILKALKKINIDESFDFFIGALSRKHDCPNTFTYAYNTLLQTDKTFVIGKLLKDIDEWEIEYLFDNCEDSPFYIVEILGKLGDERILDTLIHVLNESSNYSYEDFSIVCEEAIGRQFKRSADDVIVKYLGHENWRIRQLAIDNLVPTPSSIKLYPHVFNGELMLTSLLEAIKDDDCDVRTSAVNALGKLNNHRAIEPLITMLNDEDESVRIAVAEVLESMEDSRSVTPLMNAGFEDEARRIKFKVLAQAKDTLHEAKEEIIDLERKSEVQSLDNSDLIRLEKTETRLEETKRIIELANDSESLKSVTELIREIGRLRPHNTSTTIQDSIVSKSSIAGNENDIHGKLRELINWKEQGILTDEQFEAAKQKLLSD